MNKTHFSGEKSYQLSITVVSIVVAIGYVFQIVFGNVDFYILQSPVNIFIGGVIILSIIAFSFFHDTAGYRWFSGIPFSVTLIATILIFCLFMGLIPQAPETMQNNKDLYMLLGLRRITSSWPFVLIYFVLLLSLGALIARRLIHFRLKDYGFYLNHIGLWIILFAAGLGAADHKQYTMYVTEGETISHGYIHEKSYPLPISIHLNDFDIEEYPLDPIQRLHNIQPEPKSFVSDVEVTWKNNRKIQARIEVNKPLNIDHSWSIYQYGYDYNAGKLSTYSIFNVVYDPWINGVYIGICLLAAGAVCMIWSKKRRLESVKI